MLISAHLSVMNLTGVYARVLLGVLLSCCLAIFDIIARGVPVPVIRMFALTLPITSRVFSCATV